MLYKRYHRNYVSRFKKETRFVCRKYFGHYSGEIVCEITVEPFIDLFFNSIKVDTKVINDDVYIQSQFTLIYYNGQLSRDVIQKIS